MLKGFRAGEDGFCLRVGKRFSGFQGLQRVCCFAGGLCGLCGGRYGWRGLRGFVFGGVDGQSVCRVQLHESDEIAAFCRRERRLFGCQLFGQPVGFGAIVHLKRLFEDGGRGLSACFGVADGVDRSADAGHGCAGQCAACACEDDFTDGV